MKKKVEIAERKPSTCTFQNLHRASLAATKIYDQKLSKSGLTINQFSLLKTINHISPVSVSDLALEIRLDRTTLVRNLKPLEKAGLVVDVSSKGTRNRQLQLTSDGIKRYESSELLWQEAQEHIEQQLGKDNLNTLISLLFQIETL